ncbi:hypothetical protein F441_15786 [Phytophthora nicotianae CJ01A1]|uniref:Uncharacterized protein n=1 Tax=Phytophthora nicotianae CJ01A1 TaxID=1317063 RepID=W2WCG4_PHYNI|nr:hypothetical protein F441_15786 [Phytophthora nicotianae CJ01A1]
MSTRLDQQQILRGRRHEHADGIASPVRRRLACHVGFLVRLVHILAFTELLGYVGIEWMLKCCPNWNSLLWHASALGGCLHRRVFDQEMRCKDILQLGMGLFTGSLFGISWLQWSSWGA